jgi:outer membrane protein TolC
MGKRHSKGRRFLVLLFQAMIALPAGAAADDSVPLTLPEAIRNGLLNHPRVAEASARQEASAAKVTAARSGFLPRVEVSESFNRSTNPTWAFGTKLNQEVISREDFDPARLNDPEAINNFATILSVTLPLYDRGRTGIGVKQARLEENATSYAKERVRQEIIRDVVEAYLGVLLSEASLDVVHRSLDSSRANLQMVQSRFRSGLVVKSDLLRAEVRIAELEQEELQAGSRVEIARARLNEAMGAEIDRSFSLTSPLDGPPRGLGTLEEWLSKASLNRLELKQIRVQEEITLGEVDKARAAYLPGLYLSGSYEIDTEDFSDTANNYTVGAALHLNLFSGFEHQSRVKVAMAELRRVQSVKRQMEIRVQVETREAYFEARSAYGRIQVAKAALSQAEEGLRIVGNRYESGLFTIVHLLDAEVALQQARISHLKGLHDFGVAMARLHLAAGTLDETFR